ncbi:hypothetical protein ACFOET_08095 [Parapedobacter deserti]|uniref:Sortilin N-terminal domain-containing protein n=1 Tax=Parapedobacter deserti TaxID=1912957 RepID=A0ABV7JHQ8_9SPHI
MNIKKIAGILIANCWLLVTYGQATMDSLSIATQIVPEFTKWSVQEVVAGGRIDAIRQLDAQTIALATRGAQKGQIYLSDDQGANWYFVANPTPHDITCIAETGRKQEFYILTSHAEVYRTRDGGQSWTLLKQLTTNKNTENYAAAYAIMYTTNGTLLVTDTNSEGGHIYRSTDKGDTWTDLGAISKNALYRLEKVGNGIIVNGWDGTVYKSTDDGLTWNRMEKLTDAALFATEYLGMAHVLQADQNGYVYHSANLGYKWERCATLAGSADDFVNIGYGAAYYSTYTGAKEVFLTLDYGRNWWSLGALPTVAGDWMDHGIRVETTDSVITLFATNKGFVLRAAFAKDFLHNTLQRVHNGPDNIPNHLRTPIAQTMVGMVSDVKEINEPEDILIHKKFAYIPCRDGNNVAIIDYKDAKSPVLAYSLRDPDILDAFGVAIKGHYLYVVSMTNCRISVYDIDDPYHPRKVHALTVGGEGSFLPHYQSNYTRLRKIWIDGDYAYVTHSSESKVYILDLHQPDKPTIISSFHTGDGAFAAITQGDILYLAGYGPGSSLITVDIRDKRNPVITDRTYDPTLLKGTCAIAIAGDHLFVVAYNAHTFWSFDISDPLHPQVRSHISDVYMRGPGRIAIWKDKAFVLNSSNHSVGIIDISAPGTPHVISYLQDPLLRRVYGIAVDGDQLLLASREANNFMVIDLNQAGM